MCVQKIQNGRIQEEGGGQFSLIFLSAEGHKLIQLRGKEVF